MIADKITFESFPYDFLLKEMVETTGVKDIGNIVRGIAHDAIYYFSCAWIDRLLQRFADLVRTRHRLDSWDWLLDRIEVERRFFDETRDAPLAENDMKKRIRKRKAERETSLDHQRWFAYLDRKKPWPSDLERQKVPGNELRSNLATIEPHSSSATVTPLFSLSTREPLSTVHYPVIGDTMVI